jgi:hypothetical protein
VKVRVVPEFFCFYYVLLKGIRSNYGWIEAKFRFQKLLEVLNEGLVTKSRPSE